MSERVEHGKRHYDLCMAVDALSLGAALKAILDAGADPRIVEHGRALIEQGRDLIILANDRVGDTNRICGGTLNAYCGLRHNHEGPCAPPPAAEPKEKTE